MTTNMNMARKSSVGLGEFAGLPGVSPGNFMAMGKNVSPSSSSNFPLPLSNSQIPQSNANEAALIGPTGHNPFSPNHYGQATSNFGRPFESALEMPRTKFNPLMVNSNMAASSPSPYGPVHFTPPNENEQFPMARKYRTQDIFSVNKASEQGNYAQRPNTSNPWPTDYTGRTTNRRTKGLPIHDQGLVDPTVNQSMNMDQAFPNHGAGGSAQPPYQMQSQYMGGEMYKHQSRINEHHFTGRGIASNFSPQDFYQQEQMRQMANVQQYQRSPVPRPGSNFMVAKRGSSPGSPFPQPILPKASQDSVFSQQFSGSPKANGPHPMMNMVDGRQVPFHSPNFPGSPVASQMPTKANYPSTLGMRGTVSPNVTIGHPKKSFPPQEEGVTSPTGNQTAAAAAAAAAVRAAINAANPHTSPQSAGEMHSVPSRPPSLHGKDLGSRSPATSISDHKSESGGSGINDMGAPSPAKSLTLSVSLPGAPTAPFSSDATTGRVPSPSINQLPSSDIEAMIHSVSNIPPGNGISSTNHSSTTSQRSKREIKSEQLPKLNPRSTLSPVTPPSPFSLSPSITVDFDDILSPSWEDPTARSTTPVSKLYKLSDEPERKEFLDKLLSFMEQQGKTLGDVPIFNGVILDLYKFYKLMSERGGLHEVMRMKMWKDVVQALTNCSDSSVSDIHFLREQYLRYLLPFETKFNDPAAFSLAPTPPVSSIASSAGAYAPGSAASPSPNPQLGNIDLSTLTYKNLRMFQSTSGGPTSPFSQALPNQSSGQLPPPSYPSAPSTPQPYPGTPPMPHQAPGYRAQGVPSMPGYLGPPSGSPRVPGYPGSPSPNLAGPGYPNHQLPGFPASSAQMTGYHNPLAPQVAGYSGSHNPVSQEAMYRHEVSLGMNKHYPHMPDSQPQQSPMLGNFAQHQQQQQYLGGLLYQQQPSSLPPHFAMDRQRMGPRSTGGMPSPKHRMQAMQSPWGPKYPQGTTSEPGLAMGTGGHSPFHSTQSPGLKMPGVRPPPPYPRPKGEMSSTAAHSSSTTYSQHQAMHRHKVGAKLSPRSDEALFPPGCVEATKAVYSKKRRLTARDLGPVEAWRIMMSLKSGLLNETTWALDTLTILLSDDSTVSFFRLSHLPGLLDTVVEHFRRNLINVFGILDENEVDVGVPKRFTYGSTSDRHMENAYSEKLPHLIAEENFSAVIVGDCLGDEDGNSFTSGTKNWAHGGGDTTIHIQTHFETDVRFYEDRVSKNETNCENAVTSSRGTENDSPRVGTTDEERVEDGCTPTNVNDAVERVNDKGKEQIQRECPRLSSKLSAVYNGVTSPGLGRVKSKSMDARPDIGFEPKKYKKQTIKAEKPKKSCKGEDRIVAERLEHERKRTKIEPAIGGAGNPKECDPGDALIRRLKAELDLDIDSVGDDVEDIVSAGKMGSVGTASSEDECELKQEFPLSTLTWSQDSAIRSCICVSNILRSMSFVPGNDVEMARHPSLLLILGKLLLLHHIQRKDRGESTDGQYNDGECWWLDCLGTVRENALVTVANISGYLDLSVLTDTVSTPLLDGLLHWLVCQSADDTFRSATETMSLSPKQLVLETLAKMSVLESNVDFILLTPDKMRLTRAYEYLVKLFSDKTNEVTREFSLVLLSSLTQADESISSFCSEKNLVTVLVGFLEDAKERVEVMASRGLHPGLFHEDDMRVSMGMLRRAAGLLACIARRTNSAQLIPFQERVLALSMSRLLDVEVQSYLSDVLYNLPR